MTSTIRSDFSRLWLFALLIAALHVGLVWVYTQIGLFYVTYPDPTHGVRSLLQLAWIVGVAVLLIAAVQREPRGGLTAKIVFALIAVVAPVVLADTVLALWQHRAIGEALLIGVSYGAFWFLVLCVPALALGAITSRLSEALAAGFVIVIVYYALRLIVDFNDTRAIFTAGIGWLPLAVQYVLVLCGSVLALLLSGRARGLARIVFGVFFLTALSTALLPWRPLYAVQQVLSPDPAAAQAINVVIDPVMPRLHVSSRYGTPLPYILDVPVAVTGMPAHSLLRTDYLETRVVDMDGHVLATDRAFQDHFFLPGLDDAKDVQGALSITTGDHPAPIVRKFQVFEIPKELYPAIKNRLVRIEVEYALTLLAEGPVVRLPALDAHEVATPLGLCSTRKTPDYDHQIQAFCYTTAVRPACLTNTVELPATGQVNRPDRVCLADYAPHQMMTLGYTGPVGPGENVATFLFHHYGRPEDTPIDWRDAAKSQFVITGYMPRAHFIRTLKSAPLKLTDRAQIVDSTISN